MTQFTISILAAVQPSAPGDMQLGRGPKQLLSGTMPILLGALAVVFIFVIWAAFIRKGAKEHARRRLINEPQIRTRSSRSGRRRRHRSEKKRPTNPTLSEVGGLPPVRDLDAPPPPI